MHILQHTQGLTCTRQENMRRLYNKTTNLYKKSNTYIYPRDCRDRGKKGFKLSKQTGHKPTLVLMAGLPGVGKTTLANRLGQILPWTVIDKDTIKDKLLGLGTLEEETAGWAAFEVAFGEVHDCLTKRRRSVILDSSALLPFVLERAMQLCNEAGAELKVIYCVVDNAVRLQRLQTREQRPSQSRCHLINEEEAYQRFTHLPPNVLKLRTEGDLEEYKEEALAYLTADRAHSSSKSAIFERLLSYRLISKAKLAVKPCKNGFVPTGPISPLQNRPASGTGPSSCSTDLASWSGTPNMASPLPLQVQSMAAIG